MHSNARLSVGKLRWVMIDLHDGYGVEDIALRREASLSAVRLAVAFLRRAGVMRMVLGFEPWPEGWLQQTVDAWRRP